MADKKRKQCRKCPWRVGVDPNDIPNGYCETKHRGLRSTISDGTASLRSSVHMMACHETAIGSEAPCIGWLANQLGPGNNMGLRLRAMADRSLVDFELVGEQHERFEDTLPGPIDG